MKAIIVITLSGKRIVTKFESDMMCEDFKPKVDKKFPNCKTYLVSLTNHIPKPTDYEPKRTHTYYCPYCGDERKFHPTEESDTELCPICHISTRDFYVRKYNHLWKKAEGKIQKKKGKGRK